MAATDLPREHLSAASVIYLLLFIFAGFPVIIYCGYQLRASWREQWLTLRQRPIIASFYILCALWLVHCLIYALRDLFPRPLLRFHTQIAGAIEAVLQNSIMLLFLTRAWLLQLSNRSLYSSYIHSDFLNFLHFYQFRVSLCEYISKCRLANHDISCIDRE